MFRLSAGVLTQQPYSKRSHSRKILTFTLNPDLSLHTLPSSLALTRRAPGG